MSKSVVLATIEGKGKFNYYPALGIVEFIQKGKQRAVEDWPVRPNTEDDALVVVGRVLANGVAAQHWSGS
jgi:hypothetical protein